MKIIFVIFSIIACCSCFSQEKVTVKINRIGDGYFNENGVVTKILIRNNRYDRYWIQDTVLIKKLLNNPVKTIIYPLVEKKVNGKYKLFDQQGFWPSSIPDSCDLKCCNCIFLNQGDSIKVQLNLLKGYKFTPGEYRFRIGIEPPIMSCKSCDQLRTAFSNSIYFKVR